MAENYIDYPASLEITGLQDLSARRKNRCLEFAKRCVKNPLTQHMIPKNPEGDYNIRNPERYVVNAAHTESYRNSAVPYYQRLLNEDYRAGRAGTSHRQSAEASKREGG